MPRISEELVKSIADEVQSRLPKGMHFAIAIGDPEDGYFGITMKCNCTGCLTEAILTLVAMNGKGTHTCEQALEDVVPMGKPS